MQTDTLTPKALFGKDVRYTIPAYQRSYVWKQDDQWEPLWDDVRNTAERYLEELDRSENNGVDAERRTLPHFLGAVVLKQINTPAREIECREVVDGQQRITTLQLLLDAVRLVCHKHGFKRAAKRLSKYVANDADLTEGDQVFKLWPTASDREAFRHAMQDGLPADHFENSAIVQAHEFFQLQVEHWLGNDPAARSRRMDALEIAVTGRLQMVVIDLKPEDDSHVIFETLNARGTPLMESDLVKNYVLSRATEAGDGAAKIWGTLDNKWWKKEIRQGRLYRSRVDILLNYWLAMRTAREVSASGVFNAFKSYVKNLPIDDVMADVRHDLGKYRRFETEVKDPDEEEFHYRSRIMQSGAVTPVLLLLLSAPPEKRIRSLKALESFLVRRMACRRTTKDYNRLVLDLAGVLRNQGLDDADDLVVEFLKKQTADSREWPVDESLNESLSTLPIYRILTRGRLRLILEGIEKNLRTSKAEQSDIPKSLTIEHVMPQSWEANWPLPEGVEKRDGTTTRNQLVHTIGNLTLVNKRLNPSLSNAAWADKRREIEEHSVLFLNKVLLEESRNVAWDEQFIRDRSRRMAELVARAWPGPRSPAWD